MLANVRFTDRSGDLEADLVVALPGAGVAVLEVKGGAVTHDGTSWRQAGGGVRGKAIDPVGQARRCKYALRQYLDRDDRWPRRVRMAHLVVLPTSTVGDGFRATDCPRWLVVDGTQLDELADRMRDVLCQQESAVPVATTQDVRQMLEIVTGRPPSQREAAVLAQSRAQECDLLTARQASILDAIRLMRRVEIRGGAGSGKTGLAVEQAGRLAKDGQRVGLVRYSRGLAEYLKRRVAQLHKGAQPAYVGGFHQLGVAWGASAGTNDDSDYWERRLPEQMAGVARYLSAAEKYDAFVVDEAQDFADSWWPAMAQGPQDPGWRSQWVNAPR